MSKPHCRESRPVPFFNNGDVWSAVQEGIISSLDLDENLQFDPTKAAAMKQGTVGMHVQEMVAKMMETQRQTPAPQPPTPFQLQKSPTHHSIRMMAPAVPSEDINLRLMAAELRKMESENRRLREHIKAQDNLIRSFCILHMKNTGA